jgi:hypothetical protein
MKKDQQPQMMKASPIHDKSHNVTGGYNMWAQVFPFINFIMFLFGWFTVPIEVLFRRNFGQRWLTVVNFYAGLFVLCFFTTIQSVAGALSSNNGFSNNGFQQQQQPVEPTFWESLMNHSMLIFLILYLFISSYHFFRMWWRNRTYTALHSFNDGRSRFEPIASYLMEVVNIAAIPIIRVYMLFLPKEEQERKLVVPPLVNDLTAFTNTVFEPLILIILVFIFPGTTKTWLLLSAAALAIYANWKETAKLDKVLDFRDSIVDAQTMSKRREKEDPLSNENLIIQQAAETIKNNPEVAPQVSQRYPDLMDIIEEMNSDKSAELSINAPK